MTTDRNNKINDSHNEFLDFYGENSISPVSQDTSDFEAHRQRRLGLYRTLGIAPLLFKNKRVLEVAPGSGHNSIVTASLGLAKYDLVEPNKSGFNSLEKMLQPFQNNDTVNMFNVRFEDFDSDKNYDIVLCEGLLPGLTDNRNFFALLLNSLAPGGVLIVTCVDSCSCFFETLRRYAGLLLLGTFGKLNFEEKVGILGDAFGRHLASLQGVTRPLNDWVSDNLLNPAAFGLASENMFSVLDFLELCADQMYFYHSSPNLFRDPRWYKVAPANAQKFNEVIEIEYKSNLHRLININDSDSDSVSGLRNDEIIRLCRQFSDTCRSRYLTQKRVLTSFDIESDTAPLRALAVLFNEVGMSHSKSTVDEFLNLLTDGDLLTTKSISKCSVWANAWGWGQQYLSGVKI